MIPNYSTPQVCKKISDSDFLFQLSIIVQNWLGEKFTIHNMEKSSTLLSNHRIEGKIDKENEYVVYDIKVLPIFEFEIAYEFESLPKLSTIEITLDPLSHCCKIEKSELWNDFDFYIKGVDILDKKLKNTLSLQKQILSLYDEYK